MPPRLELAGKRFGRLVALERSHKNKSGAWIWLCKCDCGAMVTVKGSTLVSPRSSACASCNAVVTHTTHGGSHTPLYQRWRTMIDRTTRPSTGGYRNYGGRGITVCERWCSFDNFAEDMGPTFSSELELDRIDVNGNYEPGNCRWVTKREQSRNKRNNHRVTWAGRTMVVQDWAEYLGIKPNTLVHRLRRGWSVRRALVTGADPEALKALYAAETVRLAAAGDPHVKDGGL